MPPTQYKYKAFISYSHAVDGKLAIVLQSALHQFARPWYAVRAMRVFRDQSGMSANPNLWKAIESALSVSEWYLLMASPSAAKSRWVEREAAWWVQNRSTTNMLILLTEGEIKWSEQSNDFDWTVTNALPRALRNQSAAEPLFVNLRTLKSAEQLSLRYSGFRAAVVDIAATLHGRDRDELESDDLRLYRRARAIRRVFVTGLSLLTLLATGFGSLYYMQRSQTARNQINAWANSAGNALSAAQQMEALKASIQAAQLATALRTGFSGVVQRSMDPVGWAETETNATVTLHRVLAEIRERNRIHAHSGAVISTVFSPLCPGGQQLIASGGDDATVRLWMPTGKAIETSHPLKTGDKVTSLAFSGDCQMIAAASADGSAYMWRLDGSKIAVLHGQSVSLSTDGRFIVTGNDRGELSLWHKDGDKWREDAHSPLHANGRGALHVQVSPLCPDGRQWIVSASENQTQTQKVKIWSPDGGLHQSLTTYAPGVAVKAVTFSRDCARLAAGSADSQIRLWKFDGHDYVIDEKTFALASGSITGLSFSPDNLTLASSEERDWASPPQGESDVVSLWALDDGMNKGRFRGHNQAVNSVSYSPDGKLVASGSSDGTIRVWTTSGNQVVDTFPPGGSTLMSARFSADATQLAITRSDHKMDLWDVSTRRYATLEPKAEQFYQVHFTHDHQLRLLDKAANTLVTIDGEEIQQLAAPEAEITSVALGPDGRSLASASKDGTVRLWMTDQDAPRIVSGYSTSSETLRFAPDGRTLVLLASPTETNSIELWRPDRNPVFLRGHNRSIEYIDFSPDGSMVASAGDDHLVKLWSIDGREWRTLIGHADRVFQVVFHPEGKILASAGYDDTIRLWSVNGQQLAQLRDGIINVKAIAFTQDGRSLVAVTMDGTVRYWNFDLDSLLRLACQWLDNDDFRKNVSESQDPVCNVPAD